MEIIKVVEKHIGRGVEATQGAVQRQRRIGKRHGHALAQHHLHDVAF